MQSVKLLSFYSIQSHQFHDNSTKPFTEFALKYKKKGKKCLKLLKKKKYVSEW